jgi:hypothetical protein
MSGRAVAAPWPGRIHDLPTVVPSVVVRVTPGTRLNRNNLPERRFWIMNRKMSHRGQLCIDSVHAGDSAAEPEAVPGRDARIAYTDQAATDAITSGVVRESAAYQDATAKGNV